MKKNLIWVINVLLVITCFAGAWVVIALAFAQFVHKADKDVVGDFATWCGAAGTTLAVVGAFLIGERQAAAARKQIVEQEHQRWLDQVENLKAILQACDEQISRLQDRYPMHDGGKLLVARTYESTVMEALSNALATVNLASLRTSVAITKLILVQRAFNGLRRRVDDFLMESVPTVAQAKEESERTGVPTPYFLFHLWKVSFYEEKKSLISALETARTMGRYERTT